MKKLLTLIILLLLFSCQMSAQVASAPFHQRHRELFGAPHIEVEIGGEEFLFMVDTGARFSILYNRNIPRDFPELFEEQPSNIDGYKRYMLSEIKIDNVSFQNVNLHTDRDKDLTTLPWSGIIGMDFLKNYEIAFNFIDDYLTIRKVDLKENLPQSNLEIINHVPVYTLQEDNTKWVLDLAPSALGVAYFTSGTNSEIERFEIRDSFSFIIKKNFRIANDNIDFLPVGSVILPEIETRRLFLGGAFFWESGINTMVLSITYFLAIRLLR